MSAEEKEKLLGHDEFRNFRLLGLAHAAVSGTIALVGLAYFCTVVALAGTDTDAPNMALVVLSSLSICVALAGTAVVALKFRSTNTRLKCITAVFVGQTVLNLLLALLVIAMASASIPIAIETTAHVAVVVIPVIFLLLGVLTFALGILSLYAIFFRFPSTQKKKGQQRSCKVFTVSKARGRTPSPPPLEGGYDSGEEAMETYSGSPRPQRSRDDRRKEAGDRGGASSSRDRETDKMAPKGAVKTRRAQGGGADEPAKSSPARPSAGRDPEGGDGERETRPKPNDGKRTAEPTVAAPSAAKSCDERLFIVVDTLPSADSRTPAGGGVPSPKPSADEK